MKKFTFFLTISLCLSALCVKAAPVDSASAINYAKQYYGALKRLPERQIQELPAMIAKCAYYRTMQGDTAAAYYIVTFGQEGFVILTGDTRLTPVIGYSTNSAFPMKNMPENIVEWLEMRRQEIEFVLNDDSEFRPENLSQWNQLPLLGATTTEVVSPLLATTWNQSSYYNNLCPVDANGPNGHVYAGCVATAMAQIIRYWQWPTTGINSHTYTCDYGTLTANFAATTYDYANMPNSISSSSTSAQINAVATLIYHCGVSVDMDYGPGGSGAYSGDVPYALQEYFAYTNNGTQLPKSNYSDNDWADLLKNELNNLRPVYYSGSGSGGHAFVCDGYSDDGTFHFNWGWSGSYNGNYNLNSLTPGSHNYSSSQYAIIGISASGQFLRCSHNAMTFATSVGTESEAQILQVRGHSLSQNITVTAGNEFTVSTNGSNYYNSVTLPPDGGDVYVKYIPTSSANVSQTMTVVSGSLSTNVSLYGSNYTEVCLPPAYLTSSYNGSAVNLSWLTPVTYPSGSPSSATLSWDSTLTGYGSYGTGNTLYIMHRFETQDLTPYDNYVLKSITFYAHPDATSYRAVVFTGGSFEGSYTPGTMVVNQEIPASSITTGVWNTVLLNNPVLIDADEEIAFGVAVYRSGSGMVIPLGSGIIAQDKGQIIGVDWSNNSANANSVDWNNCSSHFSNRNVVIKGRIEKISGEISRYDVYRGPTLIGNSTSTTYTDNITLSESTPYTVSAIWSNGCTADATVTLDPEATTPPTVVTGSVTLINPTAATCEGNVTSAGSTSVMSRGVCWSTSPNPTVMNTHTEDGTGTGAFTSNITDLNENTTYYVRAYAMNSAGISYGGQQTFTTGSWGTPCTLTFELHDSYGDGWNGNIIKVHNRATTQTVTLSSGSDGTVSVDVYNGPLELEWVNGSYTDECSFTVSGPCLYYQSNGTPTAGTIITHEMNCGDISFVPDFTYNIANTCFTAVYQFISTGENVLTVSWDFGDGNTSTLNPATFEYTSAGTYTVAMTAANTACPTTATTWKTFSVEMPEPIHTFLDTAVCVSDLPLTWHGHTFNSTETYTETVFSSAGCDSTVTLTLSTINPGEAHDVEVDGIYFSQALSYERVVLVADYNSDNLQDIITRIHPSGKIRFYRNTGNTFVFDFSIDAQSYAFSSNNDEMNNGQASQLSNLADFDNDGVLDLLVHGANFYNCSYNSVRIYWGSATHPYFNSNSYTELGITSGYCVGAYGTDLNNDGLLDVFIRNCGPTNLYMNAGNRTFTQTNVFNTGRDITVIFDDYDQDGNVDLCYTKNGWADGGWGIRLNRGNGDGTFNTATVTNYANERPIDGFLNFQADPLDDNRPDIAFTCNNDGTNNSTVYIGEWNSGTNNFQFNSLAVNASDETRIVQAFDLNDDGYEDLIIRCKNGETYTTKAYINDGHGSFPRSINILKNSPYYPYEFHHQNGQILMIAYHSTARDSMVVLRLNTVACEQTETPTVITNNITNIGTTSATCGGNVTQSGSTPVTARGICWSTNQLPRIVDAHTNDGTGLGEFSSAITGLTPNTTYYVRAYATNSAGTSYGEQKTFTTECEPFTVFIFDSIMCEGGIMLITSVTPAIDPNSQPFYTWYKDDYIIASGSFNEYPAFETGFYKVAVTANGCTFESEEIYVENHGALDIQLTVSETELCVGSTTFLNADANGGVYGNISYNWYLNGTYYGSSSLITFTPSNPGTYTFTVIATDNYTYCTTSDQITINVNAAPATPVLTFINNTSCATPNGTIIVNAPTGNGFTYSINGSYFQTGTTFFELEANFYTVTVKNANGCTSSADITIYNNQSVVDVSASANTPCAGEDLYLTGSSNTPGVFFVWDGPKGFHSNTQNLLFNDATTELNGTYILTVTDPETYCSSSAEVTVTVFPTPVVNISGNTTINYGESTTLTATGATSYLWNTDNNTASVTVNPLTNTPYTVTGTNQYGCTGTASVMVTVIGSLPAGDGQPCPGNETLTDYDGNVYNTVKIGEQCWMKENLRTAHYSNGISIPSGASDSPDIAYLCFPGNNTSNIFTYGMLYNWSAVMHGANPSSSNPSGIHGICPYGWHVPSEAEWTQLTDYVSAHSVYWCGNDNSNIAQALASNTLWKSGTATCAIGENLIQNNATGFSATPTGIYDASWNYYMGVSEVCHLWSSTEDDGAVTIMAFGYNSPKVGKYHWAPGNNAYSVRCVLGDGADLPAVVTSTLSNITTNTAQCDCYVFYNGGANVTERGVCWSTSPNPTVNDAHTSDDIGPQIVTGYITGLTPGTTYYVRAFATNSLGTGYGGQKTFTTNCNPVNVSINSTAATICAGESTTLTASGASTYHWSTNVDAASVSVTPAATTTYTVTGTDQYGCTGTASVTINVNAAPAELTLSLINNTSCATPNGTIIVNAPTGNGFTYSIDGSSFQSETIFFGLDANYYTVTVKNANGCTSSADVTIDNNQSTVDVSASANTPCAGEDLYLTGSSSTPGVFFIWDGPKGFHSNTQNLLFNDATTELNGTYILTVTDPETYCSSSAEVTVTVYPTPVVTISGNTAINYGQSTTLTASGANSYEWSDGSSIIGNNASVTISPVANTTYTVTGTDQHGCTGTANATVTIGCNPVNVSINSTAATICAGENTTLSASGASTYHWSTNDDAASVSVTPTNTTTYYVTGTDQYGCTGTASVTINVNAAPAELTLSFINNTSCATPNGAIIVNAPTGSGFTYSIDGSYFQPGTTFFELDANFYTVTVKNANGCTSSADVTIDNNQSTVDVSASANTPCAGEDLYLTGSSSTPGVFFIWDGPKGFHSNTQNLLFNDATTELNGTYILTVTDPETYCSSSVYVTVTVFPTPVVTISGNTAINYGQTTTLTASGANSYEWSDGSSIIGNNVSVTISPVANTTYTVTGTDQHGCTGTASATVSVGCNPVNVSINSTATTLCAGESTTLTASGASTYHWSTNVDAASISVTPTATTTYTVTGTDQYGCTGTASVTVNVNATSHTDLYQTACDSYTWNGVTYTESGDHSQTFTNAAGCDSVVTLHLTLNHAETAEFTETACDSYTWNGVTYTESGDHSQTFTNAAGCDSIVTLHLTLNHAEAAEFAETACDSYIWNGVTYTESGDHSQTFSNAEGCDSVVTLHLTLNHAETAEFTETACDSYTWNGVTYTESGDHTQTFTNAASCDSVVTLHLTIHPTPVVTISGNTALNYGESTTLTASGANSYEWSDGSSIIGNNASVTVSPVANTTYTVTGTDQHGCTGTVSATVTIGCNPVDVSINSTAATICAGENTTLTASGASTYHWSTNVDAASISVTPTATTTYTVTGTDQYGCTGTASVTVNVNATSHTDLYQTACDSYTWNGVTYTESGDHSQTFTNAAGCDSTVTLHLTVNGSIMRHIYDQVCRNNSYEEYGFSVSSSQTSEPGDLEPMEHTAVGLNGCDSTTVLHLHVNPTYEISIVDTICYGTPYVFNGHSYLFSGYYTDTAFLQTVTYCDSIVTLNLTILPEKIDTIFADICEGETYTFYGHVFSENTSFAIETMNADNCLEKVILRLTVHEPAETLLPRINLCIGGTYQENGFNITPTHAIIDTTYVLYDTTVYGCDSIIYLPVTVNETINIQVAETICSNVLPYTWRDTIFLEGSTTGEYVFHRQSVFGCDSVVTLHLTIHPTPVVTISGNTALNYGESTTLTATGATSYLWNTDDNTASVTVSPVANTTYTVTGTDQHGCTGTASATVTIGCNPVNVSINSTAATICAGENTTLSASGASTYHWSTNDDIASISVTPAATTTYTVTGTDQYGCTGTASVTINVNAAPAAPVLNVDNVTICDGGQVILTANCPAAISYIWYMNGVEIPGENQAVLTVYLDQAENYQFAAKAINEYGCVSAIASEPVTVTVNAAPEFVIISDSIICGSGSMLFATVIPAANPDAQLLYTWYKDGMIVYSGSSNYFHAYESGLYKVVVSNNGCTTESTDYFVTEQTYPQLHITASESSICVGGSMIITAESSGWDYGDVTYSWNIEKYWYIEHHEGSSYIFTPEYAGSFRFEVTATNILTGCEIFVSDTFYVDDVPATPVLTVDNATIFDGGQVTLTVANPVDGATYTWYRNGNIIEGATQTTLVDAPMTIDGETTTYAYSVMAALPNSGCVSAMSDNANVTVRTSPIAMVSVEGSTMLCEGSTTTLHVEVTPADMPYTYQWYEDNMLIPGATSADYVVANAARETPYNFHVVVSANDSYNATAYAPAITVLTIPSITITRIPEYDEAICVGGQVTFTAEVTPVDAYNYNWTINGEPYAVNAATITTIANSTGPISASVAVFAANASISCSASATIDTPVQVVEQPSWTNVSVSNNNSCLGETISLEATIQGGVNNGEGTNGYIQWVVTDMFNNTLNVTSGSGGSAYDIPASAGTYIYTPTFVGDLGNGCQLTNTSAVQSTVTIHALPTAQFISGDGSALCENDPNSSAELILSFTGVAPFTYEVVDNYSNVVAHASTYANTASVFVTPNTLTTYSINLIQDTYCESSDLSNNASATVYVNAASHTDIYETACDSYTWDDVTYYESGDYTQTLFNAAGCDSVVTLHLTILPLPDASIVGSSVLCEGESSTLVAEGGVSYLWSDGSTSNIIEVVEGGLYTVTVTDVQGCSSSADIWIAEYSIPEITILGNTSICSGESTTLIATSSEEVLWYWSDGSNADSLVVSSAGTWSVTGFNEFGCFNEAYITVDVNDAPATPVVTVDNATICVGGQVSFTANVTPAGAYNYNWTINSTPQAVNAATITTVANDTEPISATVTVSVANTSAPCSATATIETPVQVVDQPSWANVSVSNNSSCLGGTISLETTIQGGVNNGEGTNGYIQWVVTDMYNNTLNVTSGSGGSAYDIPASAGTYIYTPTFVGDLGNGCQLTNTSAVQSTVTIHALPTAQFISGDGSAICENDPNSSAELILSFTGVAPFTYEIIDNYSNVVAHASTYANTASISVAPAIQTTYSISLFQDSYCDSSDLSNNASATVYVNAASHTDIYETACDNYTWNDVTYYESGDYTQTLFNAAGCDSVVTLHLTVDTTSYTEFTVETPDSCFVFEYLSYSMTFCGSDDYTFTLSSSTGCDSIITLHLITGVGIEDYESTLNLQLIPNPASSVCRIVGLATEPDDVRVYDMAGKQVMQGKTTELNVSTLANGSYIVRVLVGDKIANLKLIRH